MKREMLKKLQVIPGIGPRMAEDLYSLGIRKVSDLNDRDPEKLCQRLCKLSRKRLDPCVLYTLRCAVYFARYKKHEPRLLNWWNWKDRRL